MKAFKMVSHPFFLIASFLFLLISGESFGGFFAMYILMALPHGSLHAMLAVVGISILLFSYASYHRLNKYPIETILNLTGIGCLIASVLVFFCRDKQGYNNGSFEQFVPLVTFFLFGVLCVASVSYNFIHHAKSSQEEAEGVIVSD